MKTSKLIAAAALTLLAAAGAQAETYQGVLVPPTANSRAAVVAQAVAAAHSANPYAEAFNAGVAPMVASSVDRSTVQREAVAAAHRPNPYAEGYGQGVARLTNGAIDRATVRAEARAAARGQFAIL